MSSNDRRDERGRTLCEFLAEYDMTRFPRPSVTVDNVVVAHPDEGPAVLLIRRRNHPFIGDWALPGGFLEMDEGLEAGAARELFEETGVSGVTPVQLGAYGDPRRDPRGRIITVAFIMDLPKGAVPKAGDDAADADLFIIEAGESGPDKSSFTLRRSTTGERIKVACSFTNGRADYIPAEGLAGDHSRILADALRTLGLI